MCSTPRIARATAHLPPGAAGAARAGGPAGLGGRGEDPEGHGVAVLAVDHDLDAVAAVPLDLRGAEVDPERDQRVLADHRFGVLGRLEAPLELDDAVAVVVLDGHLELVGG